MERDEQPDFLGSGWSFPPSFSLATGSVELTSGELDIRRSLHILLTTAVGERTMAPKYGCNLEELLFDSLDTTTKTLVADRILTAILYYEPRIQVVGVEIQGTAEQGELNVEVEYVVKTTNSRSNFVLPFAKNEVADIGRLTGSTAGA